VNRLIANGVEMHLDAMLGLVVERAMTEPLRNEVRAKLGVEHAQHVPVELRGHSASVVICRIQNRRLLAKIGSEKQPVGRPHSRANAPQQRDGFRLGEVPDRAAEEREQHGSRDRCGHVETHTDVGDDRHHA